uniref:Uncharacterized protein n=1 Tax=viral metagenome TaxID=1070528 RepID=A0A6C0E074_9ZZZZ
MEKLLTLLPTKIISINSNNNIINITNEKIEIKLFVSKYSSTKKSIYKIILNDIPISVKAKITYNCVFCNNYCENYSVKSLLRRINLGCLNCTLCKEFSSIKKENQSKRFKGMKRLKLPIKTKTNNLIIPKNYIYDSMVAFQKETAKFQEQYFLSNFTIEMFSKINDKIININGIAFDKNKYIYVPYYIVRNNVKYVPVIHDIEKDVIIKIKKIEYKCESCLISFTNNKLKIQRARKKIMCKDCRFTNDAFKIRNCKNINNENLLYRSKLEKKFIDMCNERKIVINNGPIIEYDFENKKRKYYVDFIIKKYLVEIKDNHIWHKKNIESGKWQEKEKAANIYAENNNQKYIMLFPNTLVNFFNLLT